MSLGSEMGLRAWIAYWITDTGFPIKNVGNDRGGRRE